MRKRKNSSKPISKKCSIPEPTRLSLLLLATLVFAQAFTFEASAKPAPAPKTPVKILKPKLSVAFLERDLKAFALQKDENFEPLIEAWSKQFGAALLPTLKELAEKEKAEDRSRYIALMGMVRLDGKSSGPTAKKLLKAKNWMTRSAALKAIEILKDKSLEADVAKILKEDPALVIRNQAVDTLLALNTESTPQHLLDAVFDSKNYRKGGYRTGVADWVPQHALSALRTLKARNISIKLLPLINDAKDAKLRAHALHTIETLEGKQIKNRKFEARVLAWNQLLRPKKAPSATIQ